MDISLITHWDQTWAAQHPKRLTASQKEAFLVTLDQELQNRGYATERITDPSWPKTRSLITPCAQPAVIFTAHYDTPTIVPGWLDGFTRFFGHTRQIPMAFAMLIVLQLPNFLAAVATNRFPQWDTPISLALAGFFIALVASFYPLFIPNPHNREDNTSGVIGLLALADWLKDRPDLKDKVQFAILDNEEWGLLGSAALKKHWDKQRHPYAQAMIINLDCISRGRVPLLIHHGKDQHAQRLLPFLQKHLPETRTINLGIVPLSDNYTFRQHGAVDITFTDPSIIPGGYYVPRIHSPRDNDLSPERLSACVTGLMGFLISLDDV
jgi:hypothetical protein